MLPHVASEPGNSRVRHGRWKICRSSSRLVDELAKRRPNGTTSPSLFPALSFSRGPKWEFRGRPREGPKNSEPQSGPFAAAHNRDSSTVASYIAAPQARLAMIRQFGKQPAERLQAVRHFWESRPYRQKEASEISMPIPSDRSPLCRSGVGVMSGDTAPQLEFRRWTDPDLAQYTCKW